MSTTTALLVACTSFAAAWAGEDAGFRLRGSGGGVPVDCNGTADGQNATGCGGAEEELGSSGGSGQCIAKGQTCGYNGNPWCTVDNQDKCCCDFGFCAPKLGQKGGVIDMQCFTENTCVFPTDDPSESLCGAGGQQQVPCCGDDAICELIPFSQHKMMACVKKAPSPAPAPSPAKCMDWNVPCDYYNKCCDGYQCTWANTRPQPSTVCLSPSAATPGPAGSCAAWSKPCDYDNKCCKGYTCTWANSGSEKSTICL